MIPTVPQCLALMEQYRMLPNIREHSLMVARVAGLLGHGLREGGLDLSLDLLVAGALLHDIAKTTTLVTGENHADKGRELCLDHGLVELAEIVAEHVVLKNGVPERCSEKEIVYYADKRVKHDAIVDLDERLAYIIERYGNNDEQLILLIRKNFDHSRLVEEKLFQRLRFAPGDLAGMVNGKRLDLGKIKL